MMDFLKRFKEQAKSPEQVKTTLPTDAAEKHTTNLIWNNFWSSYDGLLEIACLRKSVYIPSEQLEIIEKMFFDSLIRLKETTNKLIESYEHNTKE